MSAPQPLSPDAAKHLEQSRHNYRLFERLRADGEFLDWCVTALFYAALQLVDAYAAENNEPEFPDHVQRRDYIRAEMQSVWVSYRRLEEASRRARYRLWFPTNMEIEHLLKDFERTEGWLRARGLLR